MVIKLKINNQFSTTRNNYKDKLNNDFVSHYAGIGVSQEMQSIGPFDTTASHVPRVLYPNAFSGCDSNVANNIRYHDTFYGNDIYHYSTLGKTSFGGENGDFIRMSASRVPTMNNGTKGLRFVICMPIKVVSIDSNFGVNATFAVFNSNNDEFSGYHMANHNCPGIDTQLNADIKELAKNRPMANNGYAMINITEYYSDVNYQRNSNSDKAFNRATLTLQFKGVDFYFGIPKMTYVSSPIEYSNDPMLYNYIVGGGTMLVTP